MMPKTRSKLAIFICLLFLLALGLRWVAANRLFVDYDEPIYVNAGLEYTNFIRNGQFTQLAWNTTNIEHPVLYKILYGVAFLPLEPVEQLYEKDFEDLQPISNFEGKRWGMVGRTLSAVLGSISVGVLTFLNPLAALFLAVNTLSIKYTSQVYLEALPLLTSLLSVVCYSVYFHKGVENQQKKRKSLIWLLASSILLGMTAASKYVYCVAGLAIVMHYLLMIVLRKIQWQEIFVLAGWGVAALAAFFVFDPVLWPHPFSRLLESISFHLNYAQSVGVREHNYPFYQPLRWLAVPFQYFDPRPESAFLIKLDWAIFGFAVIGLYRTFRTQKIFFLWLMIGIGTLLIWDTKWQQYVLIIMVPFCVSAAEGTKLIAEAGKKVLVKIGLVKES